MRRFLGIFLSLFIVINSISICYASNVTIYIAGDSTACEYNDSLAPRTGWGEKLADYLPKNVNVENKALSGYSSKSYVDGGKLKDALSKMNEGDIFLIQFGHNDQSSSADRSTETNTTYKEYLKKYIDGAKAKKAYPILVSSIERRKFDVSGKALPSLDDRAKAMKELAEQEGIPFIDIQAKTLKWWDYLGEDGTKELFLHLAPGESPNYPDGVEDDTHFQEQGASKIAQLIAHEMQKLNLSVFAGFNNIESPIPAQALSTPETENDDKNVSTDDFSSIDINKAAGVLRDIGFIQGDENGNLNEDKLVTRAEFLTMLSRIISDYYPVNTQYFIDVDSNHWASECIAYFTECKMIDGIGNGLFAPDKDVTLSEAVKLILSVLKFADDGFVYPNDYLLMGARCGITLGIDISPDAALTRNEAAGLIINALYIPMEDGSRLISNSPKKIYYVSAKGSEDGDGSYEKPWASPLEAVKCEGENTVILIENGNYILDKPLEFVKGGSESAPFIIRASYKGNTHIHFTSQVSNGIIVNKEAKNVVVSDIAFDMENSDNTALVECNADNFSFINNDVVDVNTAAELHNVEQANISCNKISGTSGIMMHGCNNAKISDNKFDYLTQSSVCADDGSTNCQISSNIFSVNENAEKASVILGDKEKTVYSIVLWQNVIYSEDEEMKIPGIHCLNTTDCCFYNNIIMGVNGAVLLSDSNVAPIFRNNIFSECQEQAYLFENKPKYINSDYNCFYETFPRIKEGNSKYADPCFISSGENWNLISFSPCKGSGVAIDREIKGYGGETIKLDWTDMEKKPRYDFWSMGVCIADSEVMPENGSELYSKGPKPFLTLSFDKGIGKFINNGGTWSVEDGVYVQSSPTQASYRSVYTDGFEWENYEVSADIKSTSENSGNATGLMLRCDKDMHNMYCLRFLANDQVEFVKWVENKFQSIVKWEYKYTPETFYNFKVKADKNKFACYINGELIGEAEDNSFKKGSVGCYSYRESNEYDNIKIYTIK